MTHSPRDSVLTLGSDTNMLTFTSSYRIGRGECARLFFTLNIIWCQLGKKDKYQSSNLNYQMSRSTR